MQASGCNFKRREFLKTLGAAAAGFIISGCDNERLTKKLPTKRPNILLCIADDQSWLHTGAYGDNVIKTPNFDRIAKEGVLFTHAFCAAPSCTPSRGAILTGQAIWRLEEGGILFGTLPKKFGVYPDILEKNGYEVGFTGKGWEPGNVEAGGRTRNPAGVEYNKIKCKVPEEIRDIDYAGNFEAFFKNKEADRPFCFWYGALEPHRPYKEGIGVESGMRIEDVKVPPFLPDSPEIRSDILDYYYEIEHFDEHIGKIIKVLEDAGELDNTIIAVTGDNGMSFPYAKANLYDWGVREPLAIRWSSRVKGGCVVDDFVSLADLAPTFLDCAGLKIPAEMTGHSIKNILLSNKSGRVEKWRDRVFTAIERHAWCRPNGVGYPGRAVRTYEWLYIRNYQPGRWPAGDPDYTSPFNEHKQYGDIDNGPTKMYVLEHRDEPDIKPYFEKFFGKRCGEELYDVKNDPAQMHNLADKPAFEAVKKKLREQLEQYQQQTKDPRIKGESPWDDYPFYYKDYWKLSPLMKDKL